MGFDPDKSVLNEWCEAHDVPNLYVVDGSGFPSALGVNPTLTMMAHAWRACDYIARRHARGAKEPSSKPRSISKMAVEAAR
jgi:choline dehydrogenase-like flavoprotein